MDKIRLLIVSDDLYSRKGLASIFSSEDVFEVLGGFSLDEALQSAISSQPDVVLVDIPQDIMVYGNKIVEIKGGCPCSLILAVVGDEYCKSLEEIFRYGLDGCVPRGIMRGCLVRTIELACRSGLLCLPRSLKNADSLSKQVSLSHITTPGKTAIPGQVETLTRREMEILQLMSENLSNREIGEKLFISEPTVKTHVSSILRKLGQNNRAQAIVYSYKMGLVTSNEVAAE